MTASTDRRRAIVVAVHDFTADRGYPPSYAEIAALVGLRSTADIQRHVQALARAGLLTVKPRRPRSVRLAKGVVVSRGGQVARVATVFRRCRPCGRDVPAGHDCPGEVAA